ncbi:Crp/Fnr family transcriptional regulator [Sulfurimonas sp.]|uniref:Crp/Fnr family transcriptional regulator n=1 Tax=Sulfurimonas sp. TaxID=2022749 RepID=UPI002B465CD7|nr:Crp/Fnr family transcriptional regulator [Sulfurimonas sp.]
MLDKKLDSIQKLNFFKSLDAEQINEVKEISKVVEYPKKSILYYENDTYDKIFFLVSGVLKIYKIDKFENEIFLYHIHSNSLVSELTSLENTHINCYSNSEFIADSLILEVNFTELKNRFLKKNILNNEFINEILLKTQQLHCVVNRELVFDATAKVAFMLSEDLTMFNSLKRQEVSFMLHIQPETLSRVLKKLKRSGIIEMENSTISILDVKSLQTIFRGEEL